MVMLQTYACSKMVASIVPEDTPRLRGGGEGGGSKDKTFFFPEINHVEDQNGAYSTLKVQMSKIAHTRSN